MRLEEVGMAEPKRTLQWAGGAVAGEITRGVLMAMGGLIAIGILVLLASVVVSALL